MVVVFLFNVASPIDETSDTAAEYGVKVEDGRLNYEGKWLVSAFCFMYLCVVDKVTEHVTTMSATLLSWEASAVENFSPNVFYNKFQSFVRFLGL